MGSIWQKWAYLILISGVLSACMASGQTLPREGGSEKSDTLNSGRERPAKEAAFTPTDSKAAAEIKLLKTPRQVKTQILRLYHPDPVERAWAAYQLAKLGRGSAPAIPYLLELLNDDTAVLLSRYLGSGFHSSSDTSPAEESARALARIGDPAIDRLIRTVNSPSAGVRRLIAKALGQIGSGRTIEVLIRLLRDESRKVQASAAIALGSFRHPVAANTIIESYMTEPPTVRIHLVYALSQINDIIAVPFLVRQMPTESPEVRAAIAVALGKLRDARALDILLQSLQDEDEIVRANAVYSLRGFFTPRVMDRLIAALNDPSEQIRSAAKETLTELTGMHFGDNAVQWSSWWENQKQAMAVKPASTTDKQPVVPAATVPDASAKVPTSNEQTGNSSTTEHKDNPTKAEQQ